MVGMAKIKVLEDGPLMIDGLDKLKNFEKKSAEQRWCNSNNLSTKADDKS